MNAAGTVEGAIQSFTTLALPQATTQAATDVAAMTATLNSTVNPEGLVTTVDFIYGTDPTLSTGTMMTAQQSIGGEGGTGPVSVTAPLTGLAPGTTYYDRVVAMNDAGMVQGAILSFTTLAPPAAQTLPAAGVATTAATLSASVNPDGSATLVTFVYGTDPTLTTGTTTTPAQSIGSGTTFVSVTAPVTNLTPGTKYYFHVVATSDGGTAEGDNLNFTTTLPVTDTGPRVLAVQRFGVHEQPTFLVLIFSEPLDPTSAQNLANYRLVVHGGRHPIRIGSATLSPDGLTVILRPVHLLALRDKYDLTVVGAPPGGITDTHGVFLDGSGLGQPGTNFTTTITRQNLVEPLRAASMPTVAAQVSGMPVPHGPAGSLHPARPIRQ
jgi:hypothetical protein